LCIALKDNAYGHGIEPIGQLCEEYGIKHCIVKTIFEACRANEYSFKSILILYEIPTIKYPHNYIFSINDINDIKKYPKNTNVELKIDTGMCRNGITIEQLEGAINLIQKYHLNLFGVFTHFSSADEINTKTEIQEIIFLKSIDKIKTYTSKVFRIHCSNSNAINIVNNKLYDIARIGIGIYGYVKKFKKNLQPIMSLYAKRISTRKLTINNKIGYGGIFKVQKNGTYSNYDIGYGDGFFRLNERKKAKIQDGSYILGRVSMNSFSVKSEEDEICVFDNVLHLAKVHDTIEYEILTHLMPTINRIIV
jgi:alanine racemase